MQLPTALLEKAQVAAANLDSDVFFYNGVIETSRDLDCMLAIHNARAKPRALLVLVTNGGNPDAAYKIARYFQDRYEHFTVLVPGKCKSAGTLIAVGAHELAFSPFGELGPLDIQHSKVDRFDQMQSGLTIQDSLNTLEDRAMATFYRIVKEYMQANDGLLSFASATKAASDFVTHLYGPVFSRIDPEEVGARARSMRIATDYGVRLSAKSQNLRPNTLKLLAEKYSSHSFVIDQHEAEGLFFKVRHATGDEFQVIKELGKFARFEVSNQSDFVFCALSKHTPLLKDTEAQKGTADASNQQRGRPPKNGGNPKGTGRKAIPSARNPAQRRANGAQNGAKRAPVSGPDGG